MDDLLTVITFVAVVAITLVVLYDRITGRKAAQDDNGLLLTLLQIGLRVSASTQNPNDDEFILTLARMSGYKVERRDDGSVVILPP